MKPVALLTMLVLTPFAGAMEAGTRVPAERLVQVATDVLHSRATGLPGDWEFVVNGELPDSHVREGNNVRVDAGDVDGRWPRRRVGVPVRVWVGDRLTQSRVVWFTVHRWAEVPVYARDTRAGERSEAVSVRLQRTDIVDAPLLQTSDVSSVVPSGARLKHTVRAGMPVRLDDFLPMPAVTRNQRIVLAVRHGTVLLHTPAVAQGDADIGESVKVLADSAEQWVLARVTGRNEVIIEN